MTAIGRIASLERQLSTQSGHWRTAAFWISKRELAQANAVAHVRLYLSRYTHIRVAVIHYALESTMLRMIMETNERREAG
jgi:hypothetical protein